MLFANTPSVFAIALFCSRTTYPGATATLGGSNQRQHSPRPVQRVVDMPVVGHQWDHVNRIPRTLVTGMKWRTECEWQKFHRPPKCPVRKKKFFLWFLLAVAQKVYPHQLFLLRFRLTKKGDIRHDIVGSLSTAPKIIHRSQLSSTLWPKD